MKKSFLLILAIPLLAFAGVDYSIFNSAFLGRLEYPSSGSTLSQGLGAAWQFDEAFDRTVAKYTNSLGASETLTNFSTGYTQFVTNGVAGSSILTTSYQFQPMHDDDAVLGVGAGKSFTISGWYRKHEFNDAVAPGAAIWTKWDVGSTANQDYELTTVSNLFNWGVRNLAGTLVQVNSGANLMLNMWYQISAGYDDTAQQIWIQVNGETRKTTSCVGVRRSTVQFCVGNYMNGLVAQHSGDGGSSHNRDFDEIYFWNRSLTQSEANSLISNFYPFTAPIRTPGEMIASNWCAQVVVNGGTLPGNTTSNALMTMANRGISDGWYGKLLAQNIYAPDNLTAAITPVNGILASQFFQCRDINTAGNFPNGAYKSPWDNHGPFVSGDLNANGLKPNSSAKWLGSGVPPVYRFDGIAQTYATFNQSSCGISTYVVEGVTGGFDCGTIDGGFSTICAVENSAGNGGIFYNYDFAGGNINTTNMASLGGYGFYSYQRTSQNLAQMYFANSTNTFKQYNTNDLATSAGAPFLTGQMVIFNADDTRLSWPNAQRQSYISFGAGLSTIESSNQFVAVQAMRTSMGGGTN